MPTPKNRDTQELPDRYTDLSAGGDMVYHDTQGSGQTVLDHPGNVATPHHPSLENGVVHWRPTGGGADPQLEFVMVDHDNPQTVFTRSGSPIYVRA